MPAVDDPKWRDDERKGAPVVTLHTTHGDVTVELYYKHAPRTCENFFELAKRGYYDCLLYTSPSPRDGLLSRMPSSA